MTQDILKTIAEMQKRLDTLEQSMAISELTLPSDGKLVVPVMSADPSSPTNGQIWYNSTSNKLKAYENGAVVEIDTT